MNVSWKLLSCFAALTTIASGCQSQTSPPPTEASANVEADGHDHDEHEHGDPMIAAASNGTGPVIACWESQHNGDPVVLAARIDVVK